MQVRSCFAGLARALQGHLVKGCELRDLFEYHRGRIEAVFASQPDLPLHQDTVAGFVQGFVVIATYFVPDDSVEQQSMFPALGGALLLAQDLPIDTSPTNITAGRGFIERTALVLDGSGHPSGLYELVQRAFTLVPDVPMSCASLGGFCLGVLYATPYLSGSAVDQMALISAACQHAHDLPQRP
ncbi:MAG: hypothetical protein JO309_16475 [Pseudonocardiales bacterium]|nr:hypothetical protein [Pseudonocardiales bacterium]MBV9730966.1 hypothetical protein [Pseudonocardiales bacterium]